MAIIGGAGNPVGGSFTGPSTAIEVVGDETGEHKFGYAYSGKMLVNTTPQLALSFTTGNYVFVGRIQGNGPVSEVNPENGRITVWRIEFNNSVIGYIKADTTDDFEGTTPGYVKVIIPPYTKVEVYADSNTTSSDFYNSTVMIGRLYR